MQPKSDDKLQTATEPTETPASAVESEPTTFFTIPASRRTGDTGASNGSARSGSLLADTPPPLGDAAGKKTDAKPESAANDGDTNDAAAKETKDAATVPASRKPSGGTTRRTKARSRRPKAETTPVPSQTNPTNADDSSQDAGEATERMSAGRTRKSPSSAPTTEGD
ncbi:MAG TPA: hypothetical protein VGJ28_26020 [Micromonosporaceae bacterium]